MARKHACPLAGKHSKASFRRLWKPSPGGATYHQGHHKAELGRLLQTHTDGRVRNEGRGGERVEGDC